MTDPVTAGVVSLADRSSPSAVVAAALEVLEETAGLSWAVISPDSRRRLIALAADGWRSSVVRADMIRALEEADPAGDAILLLRDSQLAAAAARVEVAFDNPFADDEADATNASNALARLRETILRRTREKATR